MQEQNLAAAAQTSQVEADQVKVQAKNFAELRSIAESAKQENLQLKQRLAQLEDNMKKAIPKKDEEDSDEPYVDHNKLRREMGKFAETMDSTIDKKASEKARAMIEEEKKNDYLQRNKDFYEVLREDEIKKFVDEHPNLAAPLSKLPDTFERQQLVYEAIKTLKDVKPAQSTPTQPKSILAQAFESRKASMAYTPGGSSGGPFQSMGDFSPGGQKQAYERFKSLQKSVSL